MIFTAWLWMGSAPGPALVPGGVKLRPDAGWALCEEGEWAEPEVYPLGTWGMGTASLTKQKALPEA